MSLQGLQSSVAALIRCPKQSHKWDPNEFFKEFDLNSQELKTVLALADHDEINKYGSEQADHRWELLKKHLDFILRFVDEEVLEDICFGLYEPKAMRNRSDLNGHCAYSLQFLRFLLSDPQAHAWVCQEAPDYIDDLIRFEIVQLELSRPISDDPQLCAYSPLAHPHFRILDLEYDIPLLIREGHQSNEILKRSATLLFIRHETRILPRIFEITPAIKDYLHAQISPRTPLELTPSIKADLQTMGMLAIQ